AVRVHRREDRRRGRGHRRRVRGALRLRQGPRAPARDRQRGPGHAAAVRGDRAAVRDGDRALRAVRRARAPGGGLAMRKLMLARRLAAVLAACGEKAEPQPGAGTKEPFTVLLDYVPNADHAGIYAAQAAGLYAKAGLDVKIQAPPDPSAPLKLLQAG